MNKTEKRLLKIEKKRKFIKKVKSKQEKLFFILEGYYLKNDKILKHVNLGRRKFIKNYANRLTRNRVKQLIKKHRYDDIVTGKNKHNNKEFSVLYEIW